MKRKLLLAIAIVLLALASFMAFYYMRPSVCILTDEVPYSLVSKMDRPPFITMDYRTTWRSTKTLERLSRYDMVIDMTLDGVSPEDNVYRMDYSLDELFLPVIDTLTDGNVYVLYDESASDEVEFVELLEDLHPEIEYISYDREMERSEFPLFEGRIVEGSYLVTFDLVDTIDFVRYLERSVVLVTDYLDSAALEKGADIVAAPDWDKMIRGFLSI